MARKRSIPDNVAEPDAASQAADGLPEGGDGDDAGSIPDEAPKTQRRQATLAECNRQMLRSRKKK